MASFQLSNNYGSLWCLLKKWWCADTVFRMKACVPSTVATFC